MSARRQLREGPGSLEWQTALGIAVVNTWCGLHNIARPITASCGDRNIAALENFDDSGRRARNQTGLESKASDVPG